MYNEELKTRFIRQHIKSLSTAKITEQLFDMLEEYEEEWQADVCTKSAEELQDAVGNIVGLRTSSRRARTSILSSYGKWCLKENIPGACNGLVRIKTDGLNRVRKQMVSSPLHLQSYLDMLFLPESEETIDNLYRCCCWMVYGGIPMDDIVAVKRSDVDLTEMSIRYHDQSIPIYREALAAFRNTVELETFSYHHPHYKQSIRRERVPGDVLLRGVRKESGPTTCQKVFTARAKKALEDCDTTLQLTYSSIALSGLFYRMYERERAGLPVNFSEAVVEKVSKPKAKTKTRKKSTKKGTKTRQEKVKDEEDTLLKKYLLDYERWKQAFSV